MESLGPVTVEVENLDHGVALIKVTGGTVDDRELARHLTRIELAQEGVEAAQFVVGKEAAAVGLERTSHWNDIMAKAKRLIESGQVQILRNSRNVVAAHVIGDHGEYNCEFSRDDPESWSITGWQCECPWDQYAWQRTRQWKKYEGRVCSHVLAAFWYARRHPMDEDWDPSGGALPRGQKGVTPGVEPMPTPGNPDQMQLGLPDAGYQQGQMGPAALPAAVPGGGPSPDGVMGPPGADVIPPQPMLPGMEPQPYPVPGTTPGGAQSAPNAVSVPGAKITDPFNPVQYPGGTFSKVAAAEFVNGMMVRLDEEHIGQLEGKSEAHGAGQYAPIPKGEIGEVLGEDELPVLGKVVEVIFAGPCAKNGPLEPYHVRAFIPASDLTIAGWVAAPGPFIKRQQ